MIIILPKIKNGLEQDRNLYESSKFCFHKIAWEMVFHAFGKFFNAMLFTI